MVEDGPGRGAVTRVLMELRQGDAGSQGRLLRLVHGELRRLAGAQMARQPRGHTLQPTALVHEAWIRLMSGESAGWDDRRHFLRAAARAMRSILVDHARAQSARKRGGDVARVTLRETVHGVVEPGDEVVAVHEALRRLEEIDAQKGLLVELRYFAGLSVEETARAMGVTERTVYRLWDRARAWLYREMAS